LPAAPKDKASSEPATSEVHAEQSTIAPSKASGSRQTGRAGASASGRARAARGAAAAASPAEAGQKAGSEARVKELPPDAGSTDRAPPLPPNGEGRSEPAGAADAAAGGAESAETSAAEFDAESVRMVVRHYLPQVRACYDRALRQHEGLAGAVEIQFKLSAEGQVEWANVHRNTTGHQGLGLCIATVLRSWRFPRPAAGEVVFLYPFTFSTGH